MHASLSSSGSRPRPTKVSHVRFLEPTRGKGNGGAANSGRRIHGGRLDDDSSSSGSESDEDSLDEEERLDRELSRRHGEAVEAQPRGSGKRPANGSAEAEDQEDIDALYQKAKRPKAKRAPDLTVESLTGPEGLLRIQTDFFRPDRLPPVNGPAAPPAVASSARFALAVVEAYRSFCFHLAPNLAFEDALLKVERLGSKRPVKRYLDEMRQNARNNYVSKVLGEDRARRVLQELHDEMQQHHHASEGADDDAPSQTAGSEGDGGGVEEGAADYAGGEVSGSTDPPRRAHPTPTRPAAGAYDDEREEELEATFADESETVAGRNGAAPQTVAPNAGLDGSRPSLLPAKRPLPSRRVLDDSDSEDDMPSGTLSGETAAATTTTTTPAAAGRPNDASSSGAAPQRRLHRFVLRDDDDDDDSETEFTGDKTGEDDRETLLDAEPAEPGSPAAKVGESDATGGAPAAVSARGEGASGMELEAGIDIDVAPPTDGAARLRDKAPESDNGSDNESPSGDSKERPESGSPEHSSLAVPLAQDSPPESSASPLSSSSSASPASPSKLASTPHVATNLTTGQYTSSPLSQAHNDDGEEDRQQIEDHPRSSNEDDEEDADDETATVVPSTLTGPTQWGDDDDEDETDGTASNTI